LLRRLNGFFHLPRRKQWMLLEAFCLSGVMRLALLVVPFRRLAVFLGSQAEESPWEEDDARVQVAGEIGRAVETACCFTPWKSKCFIQALTAKIMLRQLGIANTLYLGMDRNGRKEIEAHAWLRCGELIVTGGRGRERFTTLGKFTD